MIFAIIYSIYHLLHIVAFGSQEFSWFWQTVVNWNFLILWSSSWFATPRHKVSSLKSDERPSSGFIFKMKFSKAIAQFRQSVVTRGYFFNFSFSCASNMCFQSLRFEEMLKNLSFNSTTSTWQDQQEGHLFTTKTRVQTCRIPIESSGWRTRIVTTFIPKKNLLIPKIIYDF